MEEGVVSLGLTDLWICKEYMGKLMINTTTEVGGRRRLVSFGLSGLWKYQEYMDKIMIIQQLNLAQKETGVTWFVGSLDMPGVYGQTNDDLAAELSRRRRLVSLGLSDLWTCQEYMNKPMII